MSVTTQTESLPTLALPAKIDVLRPALPDRELASVWERASDADAPDLAGARWTWGLRASLTRDAAFRRGLAIADVVAAYAALLIALLLFDGGATRLRISAVLIAPLIVVGIKAIGLYDRDQHILRKTTLDELPAILHVAVFYTLAVWLTQVVVLTGSLTRAQVFALAGASFVLMTLRSR